MNRLLKIGCLAVFIGALGCGATDPKDKPPEIKANPGAKSEPPPAPSGKKPGGNEPTGDLKPS